MPLQYSGLVDEHLTVRQKVGIFDVSHMGEIAVRGPQALSFLQYLTGNDVSRLESGLAQYSLLLNPMGGVVDDMIIYHMNKEDYFLCVNAGTTEKDFRWIKDHSPKGVEIENLSSDYAQLALQGPHAGAVLAEVLRWKQEELSPSKFPFFTFCFHDAVHRLNLESVNNEKSKLMIARTGYTGEDGFEIFCPTALAPDLWDLFLDVGSGHGLKPAGLGARDTLRLEACFPLYGHELGDELPAIGCGVSWTIKFDKGDFIGREALLKLKETGVSKKLVGLEVLDRGIIREGTKLQKAGVDIGWVSSGTKTPTLNKAIGLAFVNIEEALLGNEFFAVVRDKNLLVKIVPMPFYQRERN